MLLLAATLLLKLMQMSELVAARFCEGGHICSLPRECCTQGCCPPYQSGPRQLPPPSEHVLNLFFISHWFFWCVVVAIILAILCAYSLWKKRRTLCGWGFNEHHVQSEGDSAGSCYAPPQYSRCNSFHHPPPPYMEVTSKPDLYPLVFTCNSDNSKNGSNYLMVQYFRNYIMRPAGSLSAASTVDSLSSSFICNINEANTLVPPPYSRAASPEIGFSSHCQQQYIMPRSASQLVSQNYNNSLLMTTGTNGNANRQTELNFIGSRNALYNHSNGGNNDNGNVTASSQFITTTIGRLNELGNRGNEKITHYNGNPREFENETPFQNSGGDNVGDMEECSNGDNVNENVINISNSSTELRTLPNSSGFVQSQSDHQFRYITNSNSSISDIFLNNSCEAGIGINYVSRQQQSNDSSLAGPVFGAETFVHRQVGGTPVIFSNGFIKPNPLHRVSTNPTHFHVSSPTKKPVFYQSNNSLGGFPDTASNGRELDSTNTPNDNEIRDLQFLRSSLETCCQILQQQQQKIPPGNFSVGDSPLQMNDITKKYIDDGLLRSYVTSGTCSGVSSLANVGTPGSPPQATSPTGEVKEILDQIRQLKEGVSKYEEDLVFRASARPTLHHTMSSPTPAFNKKFSPAIESAAKLQRISTMPEQQPLSEASNTDRIAKNSSANSIQSISSASLSAANMTGEAARKTNSKLSLNSNSATARTGFTFASSTKRPSTLQQSKRRVYTAKPNKAFYIPMAASNQLSSGSRYTIIKSPVPSIMSSNFFTNRGSRPRKSWISRSAPTTPATALPPSYLGDESPLLNEHDEDPEGEQNAEMCN